MAIRFDSKEEFKEWTNTDEFIRYARIHSLAMLDNFFFDNPDCEVFTITIDFKTLNIKRMRR